MSNEQAGIIYLIMAFICFFRGRFFGLGELPGDLNIETQYLKILVPITSTVILSFLFAFLRNFR